MNWNFLKILGVSVALVLLGCTPSTSIEPLPADSINPLLISQSITSPQSLPLTVQFEVGDRVIRLEEARTPRQQEIGLMFRRRLAPDRGMLFTFDSPRPMQFWMRNTLIPLDMVFLRDGVIRGIVTSAPPCTTPTCPTYGPNTPTNQVIELRGGRAAQLGLRVGQRLTITAID